MPGNSAIEMHVSVAIQEGKKIKKGGGGGMRLKIHTVPLHLPTMDWLQSLRELLETGG